MQNTEIRLLMKYEFLRGTKASETARNINAVFATEVTSQPTVSRRFAKLRSGDFKLTNEPRERSETSTVQNTEIRVLMKYEFLRGTKAAETARNINTVLGTEVPSQPTVSRWFAKFRSGDFELTNEPRGRPEKKVDNDVLKATVESNPAQSALDLSLMFHVSKKTILTHLAQIGKVKKLDEWVDK